jgi:hypothetical protein
MQIMVERDISTAGGYIAMSIFQVASQLEANDDLHLARLLILLRTFGGSTGLTPIAGLTKLAKLDFLLRYPTYLERALTAKLQDANRVQVAEYERKSVESHMVRFKYGPWDFRYRRFLNSLVARGLAEIRIHGRTIHIGLTPAGAIAAETLGKADEFADITHRARLLKQTFDLTPSTLVKFIYQTFPEIASLRLGEEISHES